MLIIELLSQMGSIETGIFAALAAGILTYLSIMQMLVLTPGREKIYLVAYFVRACLGRLDRFKLDMKKRNYGRKISVLRRRSMRGLNNIGSI